MLIERRDALRLRRWLVIAVSGGALGVAYSYVLSLINDYPFVFAEVRISALSGLTVAGLSAGAELFWLRTRRGAWIRRRPMWLGFTLRLATHTGLVFCALWLNRELHGVIEGIDPSQRWPAHALARDMLFSLAGLIVFLFVLQMTALVGTRNLVNLMIGRYHRPVAERKIFLFVDLKGSTRLARELGDAGFHRYLSKFFFDCDDIFVNAGGEVYSYVGDAVIVVWPFDTPQKNARPVRAVVALRDRLTRLAPVYVSRFGIPPAFRCALHGGSVVTGECGDTRQQITYLGDAVNVTARLEQVAKSSGHDMVISGELLEQTEPPAGVRTVDAGLHELKGLGEPMRVFGLEVTEAVAA